MGNTKTTIAIVFALLSACGDGTAPTTSKLFYAEESSAAYCAEVDVCFPGRFADCYAFNVENICTVHNCSAELDRRDADPLLTECLEGLAGLGCDVGGHDACTNLANM